MTAIRKILVGLIQVTLLFTAVACEKDPTGEGSFIDQGTLPPSPPNDYWDWADAFPGPVSSLASRISKDVTVRGGYSRIAYAPETPALQSTGLYAASGDYVRIDVPEGVEGLHYQIGIGQPLYDIKIQTGQRRYRDVVVKGSLETGSNFVKSDFGGFLYFYFEPEKMDQLPASYEVVIPVSNAVDALSYTYDQEDPGEYVSVMTERSEALLETSSQPENLAFVNWTELVSPKVILTLGVKEMKEVQNPQALLDVYGNIRDAYYEFVGFDATDESQPPMRVVSDIQLPNPIQTDVSEAQSANQDMRKFGGYPIVSLRHPNMRSTSTRDEYNAVNRGKVLEFARGTSFMHIHDSFGKTVFGDPETGWAFATNIHYPLLRLAALYYATTKLEDNWLPEPTSGEILKDSYQIPFDELVRRQIFSSKWRYNRLAYSWSLYSGYSSSPHDYDPYRNDEAPGPGLSGRTSIHNIEKGTTTMFVQLIYKYGWDIMHYLFERAIELGFKNEYQQDSFDYIVMACCEFTDTNLLPFFRFWNFSYTQYAADYAKLFPAMEEKWNVGPVTVRDPELYWFIDPEFPAKPDLPPTTGCVPVKRKQQWDPKPYYKTIYPIPMTNGSDSAQNKGWWARVDFIKPNTTGFQGTPETHVPEVLYTGTQRIVNGKYDDHLELSNLNYIVTQAGERAAYVPLVTVNFLDNHVPVVHTFNAFEIVSGGQDRFFTAIFDFEVYIPDDMENPVDGEGRWERMVFNMPDSTYQGQRGNWYDGVINPVPHQGGDWNRGRQMDYTYYFDKTYQATKIRFKLQPYDAGVGGTWRMTFRQIHLGLVAVPSPENGITQPPAPGDVNYVPIYKYFGKFSEKAGGYNAGMYNSIYGTDPAPPPFKGWLHTGYRAYNI